MVFPKFTQSEDNLVPASSSSIKHFYHQIQKMPQLTEQARLIDQVLIKRLQDVKGIASEIIDQFHIQKKLILQRFDQFDQWIIPIAQEVLDRMLQDAHALKYNLENKLDHLDQTTSEEWSTEANNWAYLYSKWNDRKGLVNKILDVVATRTAQLIDKDIQIVQDYQIQSLSHLSQETEEFKNVEKRLLKAIEEPLKQLVNLRNQAKEYKSLQQAAEWVSNLQSKREGYFDQLLMKIDYVMKDVVNLEETKDWTAFIEMEGEVLFMEKELQHIQSDLTHVHLIDESDRQFLLGRLEGLLDHTEDLDIQALPTVLQVRIQSLQSHILASISCLEKKDKL